jgi:hypothetical protein
MQPCRDFSSRLFDFKDRVEPEFQVLFNNDAEQFHNRFHLGLFASGIGSFGESRCRSLQQLVRQRYNQLETKPERQSERYNQHELAL